MTATDTSQIDLRPLAESAFPGGEPYRIHIARSAYDDIWTHSRGAPFDHEVGGMLVGDVFRDERGPFLDIRAAIAAEHTRNEDTQVTFTPESWVYVNRVKDAKYRGLRIVGWYHTHPRFGIFLSDRDRFIQSTSFAQPWATAFVVDPIQDLEGFFVWQNGQPTLAQEYWVGTEKRDKSKAMRGREERGEAEEVKSPPLLPTSPVSRAAFIFTVALAVVALCALFIIVYLNQGHQADAEVRMSQMIDAQRQMIGAQQQELDQQRQVLDGCNKELEDVQKNLQRLGNDQIDTKREVQDVQINLAHLSMESAALESAVAKAQQTIEQVPGQSPNGDKPSSKGDKSQPKQEKK